MDPFGIVVLGCIVALGGGSFRDVALDLPLAWIEDWWLLAVAGAASICTIPVALKFGVRIDTKAPVLAADAVGLGVFAVLGADAALQAGTPAGIAVVFGVATGIVGGILRDVLIREPPAVFTGQVYALAALAGAGLYVGLDRLDLTPFVAVWVPVLLTVALRSVAIQRAWHVRHVHRLADD
jgi:uncharacterized membrane protein YeiH